MADIICGTAQGWLAWPTLRLSQIMSCLIICHITYACIPCTPSLKIVKLVHRHLCRAMIFFQSSKIETLGARQLMSSNCLWFNVLPTRAQKLGGMYYIYLSRLNLSMNNLHLPLLSWNWMERISWANNLFPWMQAWRSSCTRIHQKRCFLLFLSFSGWGVAERSILKLKYMYRMD